MKIIHSVSSINGRAVLVHGGDKASRDVFINDIFLHSGDSRISKVVLDAHEKHVSVEMIRDYIQSSHYSSLSVSSMTVYLLYGAEKLAGVVQNTLLKTLEEVPAGKAFVLEAPSLESMLPTIQSRVFPISVEETQDESIIDFAEWRGYQLPQLFKLAEEYAEEPEKAKGLLKLLLLYVRKEQYSRGTTSQMVNYTEFLLTNYGLIGSTNVSVKLVLENSLLGFYSLFGKNPV